MTRKRTSVFILISTIALLAVLFIQVYWVLDTARMKEEIFNEKANLVLSKTATAIEADKEALKNMRLNVGQKEVRQIDSLFNFYMKFYNIRIGYFFEIKPRTSENADALKPNSFLSNNPAAYQQCLGENGQAKLSGGPFVLKLVFPDKEQFILEEMSGLFFTSTILIIFVMLLFWKNTRALIKEKEISEHTTDFLNNMTHEFKTPLTNIALAGRMITREEVKGREEKVKHYSEVILEENEKLRLQVEQVLSMTALERGEIPLQKTQLDVHRLINDAVRRVVIQLEQLKGEIRTDLRAEHFKIDGDATHLANAICNLLDNAIKYSPGPPFVKILSYNREGDLVLEFSDNGPGIARSFHKKVFEKYFRVPTGDRHDVKGFGLGLAYVKKIIELHRGSIRVKSDENKDAPAQTGTTFILTLPFVK